MITYKFKISNKLPDYFNDYIREYSSVIRFAYNRFREDPSRKASEVCGIVKTTMTNLKYIDVSIMQMAVNKAEEKKSTPDIVFRRESFFKRKYHKVDTSDKMDRSLPMLLRGNKAEKGTRKARLNVIENNSITIKLSRKHNFDIN